MRVSFSITLTHRCSGHSTTVFSSRIESQQQPCPLHFDLRTLELEIHHLWTLSLENPRGSPTLNLRHLSDPQPSSPIPSRVTRTREHKVHARTPASSLPPSLPPSLAPSLSPSISPSGVNNALISQTKPPNKQPSSSGFSQHCTAFCFPRRTPADKPLRA